MACRSVSSFVSRDVGLYGRRMPPPSVTAANLYSEGRPRGQFDQTFAV